MSCGAQLAARCPACGAESPPGAKFCIECGTALSGCGRGRQGGTASGPLGPTAGARAAGAASGARLFGGQISAETAPAGAAR